MRKILFLIITIFIFSIDVKALGYGGCDYSIVSRMKSLVNNVNISYDYNVTNDQAYFNVTLNNITPEMYFVDSLTKKTYTYSDTQNGEITIYNYSGTSSNYKFYSALRECTGIKLGTKYYSFPIYNAYYNSDLCSDIPDFSLCQRWVNKDYSYSQFQKLVNDYKDSLVVDEEEDIVEYKKTFIDIIVEWYVNYYYYLLPLIIIVCGTVIFVNRRKNRFKL